MIEDIIQVSNEAGELIRNAFGKTHSIQFKTNELNLVTETDKASEKFITDFIRKKYPSHGILAEEGSEMNKSAEYLWVIDPLDGTKNFAHGLPIFGFIFPIRSMPAALQIVTYAVPTRYYLVVVRGVILKGAALGVYWEPMLFLSIYAVVVIALAYARLARDEATA